jgi:hypothetical protein
MYSSRKGAQGGSDRSQKGHRVVVVMYKKEHRGGNHAQEEHRMARIQRGAQGGYERSQKQHRVVVFEYIDRSQEEHRVGLLENKGNRDGNTW